MGYAVCRTLTPRQATFWSAVTCHRFLSSQETGWRDFRCALTSPAGHGNIQESGDKSPHSKDTWLVSRLAGSGAPVVPYRQIRADYDRESIIVYQAYREEIAWPALNPGTFVTTANTRR